MSAPHQRYCPNCGEYLNADNDESECEWCHLEGCEDCVGKNGLCEECNEQESAERDIYYRENFPER